MGKKLNNKQIEVKKEKPTIQEKPIQKISSKEFLEKRANRLNMIKQKLTQLVKIDKNQVKKAVQALQSIREKSKDQNDLLDVGDQFIYLEIVLSKVPEKYSIRPVAIKLPTPLYTKEYNSKICIISKNPQRAYKDKISDLEIPLIQKVIGYGKLGKKYPTYVDKRKLFYEYDLFFCDKTIYGSLSKQTGKIFYQRKKYLIFLIPIPIEGDEQPSNYATYEEYLNDLASHTYFVQGNGPVYTLKVARIGFSVDDSVKNIMDSISSLLPHVLYGVNFAALRSMSVRLSNSISLPFYVKLSDREIKAWKDQQ